MTVKPLRVLSLGAGVQSTTLLLMMLEGEIEPADHAIFADTGWEPKAVYQHLEYLKPLMLEANIPLHIVRKGNIRSDFLQNNTRAASMPLHMLSTEGKAGMIRRQCTAEYKLAPLMKKQRELAGLQSGQRCKEHRITTLIGISFDEVQRMKDPSFSWIRHEYPLVDKRITRQDCLQWCSEKQYNKPPRSACIGCPFKSNDEWRLLKQDHDAWGDAVDFDRQIRSDHLKSRFTSIPFLHKSHLPLDQVDLRTNEEKGIYGLFDGFNQECEGMCGL